MNLCNISISQLKLSQATAINSIYPRQSEIFQDNLFESPQMSAKNRFSQIWYEILLNTFFLSCRPGRAGS